MLKNVKKEAKGFTIIEVMIVLLIAGIIMLIVFLAIPALQRNNRNTQRKNDASRISSLVSEYASNNNGKLPTGFGTGAGQMNVSDENFSIMNTPATADIVNGAGTLGNLDTVKINVGTKCMNNVVGSGGGARSFSVSYQVEPSGGTAGVPQCI